MSMIRTASLLAVLLAAGLSPAAASAPLDAFPAARQADADLIRLAQNRDVEVYIDPRGNRVVVDAVTGEVLSVRPRRLDRQGERRLQRQRELGRLDAYPSDDDYARYDRRRQNRQRLDDGGVVNEGPVDPWNYDPSVPDYTQPRARVHVDPGYDNPDYARPDYDQAEPDYGSADPGYQQEDFPPAPPPPLGRPERVERAPLGTSERGTDSAAAVPPAVQTDPGMTGTVPEPQASQPAAPATADPARPPKLNFTAREDVAAIQVLLDRAGASPGVIDGRFGSNVDKAFEAYREITGTSLRSTDTAGIKAALAAGGGGAFMDYEITPEDAAGPFVASVPEDYSEKAKLDRMAYTSVTEMLAERFHMDEAYLKALNPEANFNRPGTIVRVANTGANVSTKVARIVADKGRKQVRAYSADGHLVAAYPATIGSSDTPSPTGVHAVSRVAFNPNYTYNPKLNFKQGDNDKVLTIPPGPNGPVGSIWIALDKPTYGIHGTPEPSKIGKTESHGCVRLTNFDAEELARLVSPGVPVEFIE